MGACVSERYASVLGEHAQRYTLLEGSPPPPPLTMSTLLDRGLNAATAVIVAPV